MTRVFNFLSLAVLMGISCKTSSPSVTFQKSLFRSFDLTAENTFTDNIEGPAVNKENKLFVVNFQRDGTIGWVRENGHCELFATLPDSSIGNSIQFDKKGNMLVADFTGHNILMIDMATRKASVYCHNDAFNQPNDICINKKGQIFASDPNWKDQTGQLWRIVDGEAFLLKKDMGTTNGICFSPDEKILYVNESVQRKVWAFDVDGEGNLSNQRLFTSFPDFGMDGMKCDTRGNLYIARYGKGSVAVFSPAGKQIQEILCKGKKVSNLVFGGWDYKTCFITLQDRKCLEKFRTDIAGK